MVGDCGNTLINQLVQPLTFPLDHLNGGQNLSLFLYTWMCAQEQLEIMRPAAILEPFQHLGVWVNRGNRCHYRSLCPQGLVDLPAAFKRSPFFRQGVVGIPPVHLKVVGQDVQQRFLQLIDRRVDPQAVDLLPAFRHYSSNCICQCRNRGILPERDGESSQHIFTGQSVAWIGDGGHLIHPHSPHSLL